MTDKTDSKMVDKISGATSYCNKKAKGAVSRARGTRRTARKNIEDITDRKTVVALLIMGPASKVIETAVVPIFITHLTRN
jgi:hypothetical protein